MWRVNVYKATSQQLHTVHEEVRFIIDSLGHIIICLYSKQLCFAVARAYAL